MQLTYDKRRSMSTATTDCGVDAPYDLRQRCRMLGTEQLLAALKAKGAKNIQIAKVLGLPDSRIPEIKDGRRALKLDEAVKLVDAFGLEQAPEAAPLPIPILRLVVRHLAKRLGAPLSEPLLSELAEDLQAFAELVADPRIRTSEEAAEGYFHALESLRRSPAEEALPGKDRATNHQ